MADIDWDTVCVVQASYRWHATEANQLSIETNEVVLVLEKHKSGWWIGKTADGSVGIFPSNYVKPIEVDKNFIMETFCNDQEEERASGSEIVDPRLGVRSFATASSARAPPDPAESSEDEAVTADQERRRAPRTTKTKVRQLEQANAELTAEVNRLRAQSGGDRSGRPRGYSETGSSTELTILRSRNTQLEAQIHQLQAFASGNSSGGTSAPNLDNTRENELRDQIQSLEDALSAKDTLILDLRHRLETAGEAAIVISERTAALEKQKALREEMETRITALQKEKDERDKALRVADEHLRNGQKKVAQLITEKDAVEQKLALANEAEMKLRSRLNRLESGVLQEMARKSVTKITELKRDLHGLRSDFQTKLQAFRSDLANRIGIAVDMAADCSDQLNRAVERYRREARERKKWFNKVQELRGNIRVFCRVRPLNNDEKESSSSFPDDEEIEIFDRNHKKRHVFEFDKVFPPAATQSEVFADVEPLVVSVLDGYNACIFAYGQTGSGKTHTIIGPPDDPGVNKRTLEALFRVAHDERSDLYHYEFSVSIIEIYNESIFDLLSTDKNHLDNKLDVRSGGQVERLTKIRVESVDEVQTVWDLGFKRRATYATDVNEHSSRSHCLLSVYVDGVNTEAGLRIQSKLHLIDLAGSERVSKSHATGDRLKEAQAINKSLSALGDVIQALANKSPHTPFRNSKLTFLLQDSLSGESKTLMFVNISPGVQHSSESLCSLNFAARARAVELGEAKKHVVRDPRPETPSMSNAL